MGEAHTVFSTVFLRLLCSSNLCRRGTSRHGSTLDLTLLTLCLPAIFVVILVRLLSALARLQPTLACLPIARDVFTRGIDWCSDTSFLHLLDGGILRNALGFNDLVVPTHSVKCSIRSVSSPALDIAFENLEKLLIDKHRLY